MSFFIPLTEKAIKPQSLYLAFTNEVFINFGSDIVYNTFDQNRFFAGAGYQFTPHLTAQLGYMNVYQQEASGNNFMSTHAVRLYILHSIDLRQKSKEI